MSGWMLDVRYLMLDKRPDPTSNIQIPTSRFSVSAAIGTREPALQWRPTEPHRLPPRLF
jgi:hypothetical protein